MQSGARTIVWMIPFGLLVFAVVIVPLRMFDSQGVPRYRALQSELRQVEADNARLTREVDTLTREVHALRSDPTAIERIARDELGMVREDEILFQFPH